jgi:hypothetical protein
VLGGVTRQPAVTSKPPIPNYEFIHQLARLEPTSAVEKVTCTVTESVNKLNLHFMNLSSFLIFFFS